MVIKDILLKTKLIWARFGTKFWVLFQTRPLLSGWLIPYPTINLQVWAPFDKFLFYPEEQFSDVDGVGGSAKTPGGGGI